MIYFYAAVFFMRKFVFDCVFLFMRTVEGVFFVCPGYFAGLADGGDCALLEKLQYQFCPSFIKIFPRKVYVQNLIL
jgi:hypothetical protein